MRTKMMAGTITAVIMASLGTAAARQPASQDTSTSSIPFQQGVHVMRVVASAEAAVAASRGQARDRRPEQNGYGTLAETLDVIQRDSAVGSLPGVTIVDTTSASMLDYTLQITRSEDRSHYSATLTPVKGCGLSFFTDDRNVIYTGKSIGC
jgi:hypothetical protein